MITVEVCERPISMELDTGQRVCQGQESLQAQLPWSACRGVGRHAVQLLRTARPGRGSSPGQHSPWRREATLPLYLIKGSSPTLLGRKRIQALGVRWLEYQEAVHVVEDIPGLLTKFKALFQPGLGTFTGTAASIHVPEGARPRFSKPRLLPFALKDGVTQELQRLQREDILVPVKLS